MMKKSNRSGGAGKALVDLSLEKFAASSRADFRFAPLNALLLVAIFVAGLVVHLARHPFSYEAVVLSLGSALASNSSVRFSCAGCPKGLRPPSVSSGSPAKPSSSNRLL